MIPTILITALGVGLLQGFLHCSGMCGPFVLAYSFALPKDRLTRSQTWTLLLAHNIGRIAAFTMLGIVFGLVGSFVNVAAHARGLDAVAGIVGGSLMVLWAVDEAVSGHGAGFIERWSLLSWKPLQERLRRLLRAHTPGSATTAGLILGLHPCGLLFAVLLTAASAGSWWKGGLTLLTFGIGTVPALFSVALAGFYGRRRLKGRWASYVTALFIGISGLLFVLRGLAVNGWIPEVNPWLF